MGKKPQTTAASFYDLEGTLVSTNLVHTLAFYARRQQGLFATAQPIAGNQFQTTPVKVDEPKKSDMELMPQTVESISPSMKETEAAGVSIPVKVVDKNKQTTSTPAIVAVAEVRRKSKAKISLDKKTDEGAGGSRTSALTSANTITPHGINRNKTVRILPNLDDAKHSSVKEVLQQFGIEAVFINEIWHVKSVGQNSLAERSGVKTGDTVDAIGDEKLTDKPLKSRIIEGRKLAIRRGAEKIQVVLGKPSN
jgi:hypothetical protein